MDIYIEGFDDLEVMENVYEELLSLGLDVELGYDAVGILDYSDIDDTYTRNYVQQILDELEAEGYIVTKV
tara:strand:+ start:710 stop:919 length:210 start_codon:yes stop_codon:yes gene_type:complete